MADIEPYCDSEEEVFFGPVTEKEKLLYKALRRKSTLNKNTATVPTTYVGSDEGLHALAEAASMLSISSGEMEQVKREKLSQGTVGEEDIEFCDNLSSLRKDAEMTNRNEGSTMELDAVKFLTKNILEQNGKFEVINTQDMDEMYENSEAAHNTSLASVENSSCSFNNHLSPDSPADSFLVLEAQCKMDASNVDNSHNFNFGHVNINTKCDSLEKKSGNLIPICELEQLPPLNLSSTELQDLNDRSEFEMKISDNEEEIEKVERNLKVEEIIKFLADEDTKIDSEERSKTCVENSDGDASYHKSTPQKGNFQVNEDDDDDDVIIIEVDDNDVVDLTGSQKHAKENSSRNAEIDLKCEIKNVDLVSPDVEIKIKITPDEMVDDDHGLGFKVKNESENGLMKLSSVSLEEQDNKQTFNEHVKIPSLSLGKGDTIKVSNLPVMKQHGKVSSMNGRDAAVTQRHLKTPSKVHLRPGHGAVNTYLDKQPLTNVIKRYPGTPGLLMSPLPSKNAISSAQTPLKGASSTTGSNFKTPNSKTNTLTTSKIPQAFQPVAPSPRKNKFADVMSPVAQYIHGKSRLLVSNKNAPVMKSNLYRERMKTKSESSDQTNSVERSEENIDVNNISSPSMASNIYYKSAVPVKIFSPSPRKCQGNAPVGSVYKHIGRMKITDLKTGEHKVPLGVLCRDSLIPDGEVSVLIATEMDAEHTSSY